MTNSLNNLLLPVFLFILFFSIASNIFYTPTKMTVSNQNIFTHSLLTAAHSTEPTQFDNFYSQIKELFQEDRVNSSDSPRELTITIPQVKEETIAKTEPPVSQFKDKETTEVQPVQNLHIPNHVEEITKVEQIDNIPNHVEEIINDLNKRQTLRLFTPLQIRRKVDKIDKTLAVTKSEILTLYKENPEQVVSVLQKHLPELFI